MNVSGSNATERFVYIPPPTANPSYMKVYSIEAEFEFDKWRTWMGRNWVFSLYASLIYLTLIVYGKKWMQFRKPYELRGFLTVWNLFLATFSIVGFSRVFPEIAYLIKAPGGFHTSVCFRDGHNMATAFWGWWCTLSKLVELGDTAFIVLRKQPLIFLHYYHHITVFMYTWFTYEEYDPSLKWFMAMNFFVHGIMYSYYGLKAIGMKISRKFAMIITTLQLGQMVLGVSINIHSLLVKSSGGECQREDRDIYLALGMYASYFILFANFFLNVYFKNKRKTA